MKSFALLFLLIGVLFLILGLVLLFADKIPWLGNLPGDFHLKFKDIQIHLPLMTCILISLVLTILLNILFRIFGK